jgi:hypothetical protein
MAVSWPPVTLVLITFRRPEIIRRTLDSLVHHLSYPNLGLHIADDGTGGDYVKDIIKDYQPLFDKPITSTITERGGWGKNANEALKVAARFVYQQEDDYMLKQDLDLRRGVATLLDTNIAYLRYRGIAGHRLTCHVREAKGEWGSEFTRPGTGVPGVTVFEIDRRLGRELYVYTHGPHLKEVPAFHGAFGMYAEGLPLGATEEEFAHRIRDWEEVGVDLALGVLPEWVEMQYDHIGESYQLTDADNETVTGETKEWTKKE